MDGYPTTGWCRVSFWMVKLSRSARPNASRSSDACSQQRSGCAVRRTCPEPRGAVEIRERKFTGLALCTTPVASTIQTSIYYMSENKSNITS
jgi:hypothetical protein